MVRDKLYTQLGNKICKVMYVIAKPSQPYDKVLLNLWAILIPVCVLLQPQFNKRLKIA